MTIALTRYGNKIEVVIDGSASGPFESPDDITLVWNSNSTVDVAIDSLHNPFAENVPIADLSLGGVTITSLAVFKTQMALVFPNAGSSTAITTDATLSGDGSAESPLSAASRQATSGKDASGGYVGLTLFKINFKNALNTFTSFFTNSNTAARTYTFQDRDGTIADDTDLGLKQSTSAKDATGGYVGLTLFKINFKNTLNTITSFFTNANTVARTYTFQDRDGTIADNTDLALKATLASANIFTTNGALSAPANTVNGTWIAAGGTATTTKPQVLIEPSTATSTGWSTVGTGFGVNAASGFTGNLVDFQANGTSIFKVSNAGVATLNGALVLSGTIQTNATNTSSNLWSPGASGSGLSGALSTSQYLVSSTNIQFRVGMGGSAATTATANTDVANVVIGSVGHTEAVGGTCARASGLVVVTQAFTNGAGATTDFQNIYAGDAPTGGTNNWSINAGASKFRGQVTMAAPTTSLASFNLPAGTAPSSPVDGDVWREDNTNTGLKIRINGVTKTITVS